MRTKSCDWIRGQVCHFLCLRIFHFSLRIWQVAQVEHHHRAVHQVAVTAEAKAKAKVIPAVVVPVLASLDNDSEIDLKF